MCDRCARPPACLPVCHPIFDQFVSFSELMNRPPLSGRGELEKRGSGDGRVIYNNQVQSRERLGGGDPETETTVSSDAKVQKSVRVRRES